MVKRFLAPLLTVVFFALAATTAQAQMGTCGMAPTTNSSLTCPANCPRQSVFNTTENTTYYSCPTALVCGQTYNLNSQFPQVCNCDGGSQSMGGNTRCCGWVTSPGQCSSSSAQIGTCGMAPTPNSNLICPSQCQRISFLDQAAGYMVFTCGNLNASCGETYTSAESTYTSCGCEGGPHVFSGNQICCGWLDGTSCLATEPEEEPEGTIARCGQTYSDIANTTCNCQGGVHTLSNGRVCCGWINGTSCSAAPPDTSNPFNPTQILDDDTFDELNPLKRFGNADSQTLTTPGAIFNRLLTFAFPIAGLILFVMLVWAGFEMIVGATDKKAQDAGKQRATAAVIGFVLLFVAYWIIRLLEVVFGVGIF